MGLRVGRVRDYGWALGILVVTALLGYLALQSIPSALLDEPGVTLGQVTTAAGAAGTVLRALGEEVFFRGFVAGLLFRRWGFAVGNLAQSLLFLLPHLLLLLIDTALWPILPVQLVIGWLLGWLRHRSGSIAPPALVHSAGNLLASALA